MHGHHADAVAGLLEDRRLGRVRILRGDAQFVDEAAERQAPGRLVFARQLGDVQHVGQRLLAAAAQDDADVRARRVEQLLDRLGHGPVVAAAMQPLQDAPALSTIGWR